MSKYFKKRIYAQNFYVPISRIKRGNCISYVIRYHRNGYSINACGTTQQKAVDKFIEKINKESEEREILEKVQQLDKTAEAVKLDNHQVLNTNTKTFNELLLDYYENYKKRKVSERTYNVDYGRITLHILPYFMGQRLEDITSEMIQAFIDRFEKEKKYKTAHEIYSILNGFFRYQINIGQITKNPLSVVLLTSYEKTHGIALTKKEERELFERLPKDLEIYFAIALYTGMRPNEYTTTKIENGFIICNNSKRKNGKKEMKKIPIHPMLKKHIVDESISLTFPSLHRMRDEFKKIFPNHKVYDLRTTFYTRLCECSVSPYARDFFIGHSSNALQNAYLDLPDDFLKVEAEKIEYKL